MKTMRLILRDRGPAGTIAALITYLLLIQAVLAGLAQGAMVAPPRDPAFVICTSHGPVTIDPAGSETSPANAAFHCPCATLCQLAATSAPAVLGGFLGFANRPSGQPLTGHRIRGFAPPSPLEHLAAEARAPPTISI